MTTTQTTHNLYRAACITDKVWMTAIIAAFPRLRAGDVRYTPQAQGEPGSALRAAYDSWVAANKAWRDSL